MEIRLIDTISGKGLYFLAWMVDKTCRFQTSGDEHIQEALATGQTVIFASWHGLTLGVIPYLVKNQDPTKFVCLMPDDWRGASLKVFAEHLGAIPHPMKLDGDSTIGQGRELVKLVRHVVGGKNLFINPDGPDGPSQVIKPGITYIAKKSKALIFPIGAYARHAYIVPRWDRYVVPYPFSRISFYVDPPFQVSPDGDLNEANQRLTTALNRADLQAAANYYEQKP